MSQKNKKVVVSTGFTDPTSTRKIIGHDNLSKKYSYIFSYKSPFQRHMDFIYYLTFDLSIRKTMKILTYVTYTQILSNYEKLNYGWNG